MIKVKNGVAVRESLPRFLRGLSRDSLADLSWIDPALGLQGVAWWPAEDQSSPLPDDYHRYGTEALTPDPERRVVVVVREVVPPTASEQAERLEQAKTRQRRQIEEALAAAIGEGLPYTMPDGTADVIQMRGEDRQNLLGLAVEARDLQAAGETGAVQELRAMSNARYPMTPAEMIAATDAALAHFKQLMARSWDRKDAVTAVVLEDYASATEAIAAVEAITW
ncbi:hypothetical protein ACGTNG_12520 [Halomonas sp. 1390]|uniref:DUF4376 domain-containing protein n=1 Tax=Halomonas sp. B23F22_3 TaxID=3459516 RepID=UPI00373E5DAC